MKPDITTILDGRRHELCDMPWSEYLTYPALNCSTICAGTKSMLHLKHAWDHGNKDTPAKQWGRMVHCLLLEPTDFENRYWEWAGDRRGKVYYAYRDRAEAAGAEVAKASGQYSLQSAQDAAESFLSDDRVQELISAGQGEQTVLTCEGDIQCRGQIDWVSTSQHVMVDLKTAADIGPEKFGKSFFNFHYDMKLGMYRRWLQAVTCDQWPVEVIVLESTPPHDVAVIPVPDAVLDAGVDKAIQLIWRVKTAIDDNQWPGMARNRPMDLVVPYYEMVDEDIRFRGE